MFNIFYAFPSLNRAIQNRQSSNKMILKKTDLQLVLELQKDGRSNSVDLAAKIGISPTTVTKRIRLLLDSETIQIRALPNPAKLGMVANAVITIKAERSQINKICNQLYDNFNVNLILTVFGRFDIVINIFYQSWEALHSFIYNDLSQIDGILHIDINYIREIKKRYELIFSSTFNNQPHLQINEDDWKLIKELVKDGRASIKELSEKLGMTSSMIYRKISNMVAADIIKIAAIPNGDKFGFLGNAFVNMNIRAIEREAICDKLRCFPEIHMIMTMISGSEICIGIQTPDTISLYNSIEKYYSSIPGILNMEILIRSEVRKRYYGWYLQDDENILKNLPILTHEKPR